MGLVQLVPGNLFPRKVLAFCDRVIDFGVQIVHHFRHLDFVGIEGVELYQVLELHLDLVAELLQFTRIILAEGIELFDQFALINGWLGLLDRLLVLFLLQRGVGLGLDRCIGVSGCLRGLFQPAIVLGVEALYLPLDALLKHLEVVLVGELLALDVLGDHLVDLHFGEWVRLVLGGLFQPILQA